jgi:ketosteroid isomerase-like protein
VTGSSNLELVRSIYAAWERGDFGALVWADAEIELVVVDGPEPVSLRGLRATLEYWRRVLSAWKGYRIVADEYWALEADRVLVLVHSSDARGKRSGLEPGRHGGRGAQVFSVRADKVTRLVNYFDRDRALADLGLAPEGDAE